MDKKYIEKHGLTESINRFRQLFEYTDASGKYTMNEDGEEDPNMGGAPAPDMGGEMGAPDMSGAPAPDMGGEMAAPDMDGAPAPDMRGAEKPQGLAPQGAEQPQPEVPEEEEEEVIDVDELVNSQEETEDKLEALTSKFDKLLDKIDGFEEKINASNERMDTLKAEIEKRNPTPVEKLSLRSKNSYPFNVSPEEYWKDKEMTSNYSTEDDANGANDQVYQITKDEIDNFNDYASIADSFDNYGLKDMFNY